ncbi:MAG TPA: HD domain-containing protein [Bryobacteraceae bacterium]|jgi:(p)ppGpp synthase/HD superfamily hydrolase
MATLERAIAIAAEAHTGQKSKEGSPYILHPIRVMMRVDGLDAKMAAILHDVVEDTDWTLDQLRTEGFSQPVLEAVDLLTHRDSEDYFAYVARAGTNPLAKQVKLADLEDNMNVMRLATVGDKDLERMRRYHKAWLSLKGS